MAIPRWALNEHGSPPGPPESPAPRDKKDEKDAVVAGIDWQDPAGKPCEDVRCPSRLVVLVLVH